MGLHPAILLGLCAGAGTSTPSLAALERRQRAGSHDRIRHGVRGWQCAHCARRHPARPHRVGMNDPSRRGSRRRLPSSSCLRLDMTAAQARTDVVTLANGDRITGEVVRLDRGPARVQDRRYRHALSRMGQSGQPRHHPAGRGHDHRRPDVSRQPRAAPPRSIAVVSPDATAQLLMQDVTEITTIGRSFWRKVDGSFDVGFSYTRSSGVAQLNLNSYTVYNSPGWQSTADRLVHPDRTGDSEARDATTAALSRHPGRDPWPQWFRRRGAVRDE